MSERVAWERHPNISGLAGMLLHIHDSFRAASQALLTACDAPGDDLIARLRRVFDPLARTLHHHHHAEEEMLFPLLRARSEHPDRLLEDHRTLTARLDEVASHLETGDSTGIATLLRTLDTELCAHLDREESTAVPVLLELSREETFRLLYGP